MTKKFVENDCELLQIMAGYEGHNVHSKTLLEYASRKGHEGLIITMSKNDVNIEVSQQIIIIIIIIFIS